jgi:hypothetical protein
VGPALSDARGLHSAGRADGGADPADPGLCGRAADGGALNFIGPDALYGRYWGALVDKPFLHFELCYYQAIDAAIALGLPRVEAGAQGGHKLARGYEPVQTWSAHYIVHPGLPERCRRFSRARAGRGGGDQLYLAGANAVPQRIGAPAPVTPILAPGNPQCPAIKPRGGGCGDPFAGAALGFGDFAGGHFVRNVGAADLRLPRARRLRQD